MQITNNGWSAFNAAEENMDKIQLYMQQVPTEVENAMRVVGIGNTHLIKLLLPKPMQHIKEMSRTCVMLANNTHDAFVRVMELIGEVMEATTASKGLEIQKLKTAKLELNATRAMEKSMEEYGKQLKKQASHLQDQADQFHKEYEHAMDQIPTGWAEIGQDFVRGIVGVFNDVTHMVVNAVGNVLNKKFGGGGGGSGGGGSGGGSSVTPMGNGVMNTNKFMVQSCMSQFSNLLSGVTKQLGNVLQEKKITAQNDPAGASQSLVAETKSLIGSLATIPQDTPSVKQAKEYLQKGESIFGDIKSAFSSPTGGFPSDDVTSQISNGLSTLMQQIKPLAAASMIQSQSGGPAAQSSTDPDANAKYVTPTIRLVRFIFASYCRIFLIYLAQGTDA